ncbi:uncharacterized protein LOC131846582 [Achroia grisella]|uniref:uncharacterized protein LOC131846582 n=1 Tax=Achroia grisella TaxID=688607 RepID=UPI0027D2FBE8|nr:uncharacterized protein LOC131846582 [Achroia grisella]
MTTAVKKIQFRYDKATHNIDYIYDLVRTDSLTLEQKTEFQVRYADLENNYQEFDSMHSEMQLKADESELEKLKTVFETYNKKYYFIKRRYIELSLETKADYCGDNIKTDTNLKSKVILPRLALPSFSGKLQEFNSFMELFQSLIDQDVTLTNTEKLYYLSSSLVGEPKTLIQHLSIVGDNYSIALELLKARYNNKRLLADKLLHNLLSAAPVTYKNLSGLKLFVNTLLENTKALEKMNFPVDSWSYILFYINFQKLDSNLKRDFENKFDEKELPAFEDLLKFLEGEIRKLESSADPDSSAHMRRRTSAPAVRAVHSVVHNEVSSVCKYCGKSGHFIAKCEKFLSLKPTIRKRHVISTNLCFRCLNSHNIANCQYNRNCYKCNSPKHHSLLHFDIPAGSRERQPRLSTNNVPSKTDATEHPPQETAPTARVSSASTGSNEVFGGMASQATGTYQRTVLLSTAIIRVLDKHGYYQEARALLDGGSQGTFISEHCANRLGLKRLRSNVISVTGLSGIPVTGCKGVVNLNIMPRYTDLPVLYTAATVLNKITRNLPGFSLSPHLAESYRGILLADEQFYISREIDILIGADIIADIYLGDGTIKIHDNLPRAMNTVFGHVLTGPVSCPVAEPASQETHFLQTFCCNISTDSILERFWEVEDIPSAVEDPKDMECESMFVTTHQRDESGRYVVHLPFLSNRPSLGDSVLLAKRRFFTMERKLQLNESLRKKYVDFMREYAEKGHMSLCVGKPEDYDSGCYIICHHGIFKTDSDNIRVVFDASGKTSNGVSLNDCLHAGPKLQRDIMEIICRFRLHKYVFTTDIRMMFRQILITPKDRAHQLIFWRESPDMPLQLYELNTVTYGMKSSPYLAIRTLRQLADDEERRFPAAARLLRSSVYMDDILGGADTLEETQSLKRDVVDLLKSGGFELSKWTSNTTDLLKDIPAEHLEKPRIFKDNADGPSFIKLLGIQWDPSSDSFSYHTRFSDMEICTKRSILSTLARTFDPLGWISPVIFQGKILMQRLWLLKLSWDDKPPADVVAEWQGVFNNLPMIENLKMERFALGNSGTCSIHGFADASELGYGAAVYLRTVGKGGQVKIVLMMAKSRVSPVKSRLTIPKLELCGAALLVRLVKYVVDSINEHVNIEDVVCWSDSTIVLSWLRISPHLLQTFEGNRVSQIINCGLNITWRHVPSELNPADIASRGCRASELLEHKLWWGPSWLQGHADTWPLSENNKTEYDLPGIRKTVVKVHAVMVKRDPIFLRFSSLNMLLAVVAYCYRFFSNCKNPNHKVTGVLTTKERQSVLLRLIKLVQIAEFADDLSCLKRSSFCSLRLRRLMPFICGEGLLRVGGRLNHSDLSYNRKHPVLLPKDHPLTSLIIDHHHKIHCHAGSTALQAILQTQFWIISARQAIRTRIFKCISCFRTKAKPTEPLMSALPTDRVVATGVFHTVQTDFAGPFIIKSSRLRNAKPLKAYLCVFICSSTKCVHLECVTDLSTEGFLAALTRFTSRRGLPSVIRSDNGTNYVGTNRHLDEVQRYLASREVQSQLSSNAGKRDITWRFNAPAAPHFGGLFEATVKAAKTLLRRVIGDQILTFEELVTIFTKVEAVLNCRPLCPLTQDPQDLEVLTPAHFLIGRSLLSVPEYNFEDIPNSRLSRYNLIQALSQRFWRKWSERYLHSLQMRNKWTSPIDPPKVDDLVLIKEENLPPLKWRLGRIVELLPGKDGVVRVVRLITSTGTITRPVVKICRLPTN